MSTSYLNLNIELSSEFATNDHTCVKGADFPSEQPGRSRVSGALGRSPLLTLVAVS